MGLPPARTPGTYRVAVVCLGNICRSPIAHVVLEKHVADAGLGERVSVISAGTADWHQGKPMDGRAAATLTSNGYDPTRHRARQIPPSWLAECDLVLAMDADNLADLRAMGSSTEQHERVRLFRDFDPGASPRDRFVPDPYYGGPEGFELVLDMVVRTSEQLVTLLTDALRDVRRD